jgi:uncharacterized membrane protein YbaN (DUF454 family)
MDWVASALCLIGNIVLIKKKHWSVFVIYFIANSIWAYWWFVRQEWAAMILVSIFMAQNIYGFYEWRKNESPHSP